MLLVAPREGRVSRNGTEMYTDVMTGVAPREGRVSRNDNIAVLLCEEFRRAPRGACE